MLKIQQYNHGWTDQNVSPPGCHSKILTLYIHCTAALERCSPAVERSHTVVLASTPIMAARSRGLGICQILAFPLISNLACCEGTCVTPHWALKDRDFSGHRHFWSCHPWEQLKNFFFFVFTHRLSRALGRPPLWWGRNMERRWPTWFVCRFVVTSLLSASSCCMQYY